ncbi:DMT family transporter [Dinoroseobacter sp. S124A]|uniref:DMT family transporter n=1 Tax=Dinoroseobacter sp. S124A TaxID=3415128 RepID=UPI003C7DD705
MTSTPTSEGPRPGLRDLLLWGALAAAWSSSYVVIKLGVADLDPMLLVAGRMLVGTLVLTGVFFALGQRLSLRPGDWLSYGVTGLLGSVVPFLLITHGETVVESALAAILMGLSPVATAGIAACVLPDERLTRPVLLGLGGALVGVTLLAGPSALLGLGTELAGQVAILGAALCYALSTVYIRRCVRRPPLEMAAGSALVGTAVLLGAVGLSGARVEAAALTHTALGAVLYLGLVSTAAANLVYFHLVPRLGATRMSQVNFAVPVGGALLGVLLLGEDLSPLQWGALGVIIASVWLSTTARRG